MGNAARRISQSIFQKPFQKPQLSVVEADVVKADIVEGGKSLEIDSNKNYYSVLWIASTLVILQILDGLLTGTGMYYWGIGAEGNPLLKMLMHHIGYVYALLLTKSASIVIILILAKCALTMEWVKNAMKGVAALYIVAAVIPWTYLITLKLLICLLYTSPSPRDATLSRMPSSA